MSDKRDEVLLLSDGEGHSLYSLETFDICQNSNSEPYGFVYIF